MKHEHLQDGENLNLPLWPEPAHGHLPPASPPSRKAKESPAIRPVTQKRKRGFWYYLGLQVAGLCCCAVLIVLAVIAWSYITYYQQGYIAGQGLLSLGIFLGAIFLSSCLMTVLGRGGPIYPALIFSLLVNAASFKLAELSLPPLNGILLKVGLSLISAAAGFILAKLLIMKGRRRDKSNA